MNRMQIWNVNGIDDLEGICFAQCSTKEKAEKAMRILEENGFEDMLVIKQFNDDKSKADDIFKMFDRIEATKYLE